MLAKLTTFLTPIIAMLAEKGELKELALNDFGVNYSPDFKLVSPLTFVLRSGSLITMDTPYFGGINYYNKLPMDKAIEEVKCTIEDFQLAGVSIDSLNALQLGVTGGVLLGGLIGSAIGSAFLGPLGIVIGAIGVAYMTYQWINTNQQLDRISKNQTLIMNTLLALTTNLRVIVALDKRLFLDNDIETAQSHFSELIKTLEDKVSELGVMSDRVMTYNDLKPVFELYVESLNELAVKRADLCTPSGLNDKMLARYGLVEIENAFGDYDNEMLQVCQPIIPYIYDMVRLCYLQTRVNLSLQTGGSYYTHPLTSLEDGIYKVTCPASSSVKIAPITDFLSRPCYHRSFKEELINEVNAAHQSGLIDSEVVTKVSGSIGMSFLQPTYKNQSVPNEYDVNFYFTEESSFSISLDSKSDRLAIVDFEGDEIRVPYVIKCNKSFSVLKVNSIEQLHVNKWSIDETGLLDRVLYGADFLRWLKSQSYEFNIEEVKDLVDSTITPLFVYYQEGEIRVGTSRYWALYGLPKIREASSQMANLCNNIQKCVDDKSITDLEVYISAIEKIYQENNKYVVIRNIETEDTYVYGRKYSLGSVGDAIKRYSAKQVKGKNCFYFMANGWMSSEEELRGNAEVQEIENQIKYQSVLVGDRIKFKSDGKIYKNVFKGICPTPICSFLEGKYINYVRKI